MPARVLLQDFTGVPCVVDLAAMRDGIAVAGRRPGAGQPAAAGRTGHRPLGAGRSLRHRQRAGAERRARIPAQSRALRVPALGPDRLPQLPRRAARDRHRAPGEHRVPGARGLRDGRRRHRVSPTPCFGTDSHTTMVNGLGVVGWGVGGIEAEAAMLGQPSSMLIPPVVGCRLTGRLPEGATATDLVLTITEALRKHRRGREVRRVLRSRPAAPHHCRSRDARQHVPRVRRHGGDLPDRRDDARLPAAHRPRAPTQVALVEAYARAQGLFRTDATPDAVYTETLELDLATVVPSLAGPRRPQDRVPLSDAKARLPARSTS